MRTLSLLTLATTSLIPISNINNLSLNTKIHAIEKQEEKVSVMSNNNFDYINNYFENQTDLFIEELKQDLLQAISIENGIVNFNIEKLNKRIWDKEILNIIDSLDYESILQNEYNTTNSLFSLKEGLFLQNGMSLETHWYWFGVFILHMNSKLINRLWEINVPSGTLSLIKLLMSFPALIPIATILAPIIITNMVILKSYDKGNGAWLRAAFYMPVPLAWGSN